MLNFTCEKLLLSTILHQHETIILFKYNSNSDDEHFLFETECSDCTQDLINFTLKTAVPYSVFPLTNLYSYTSIILGYL